jgi:hypothetical protein
MNTKKIAALTFVLAISLFNFNLPAQSAESINGTPRAAKEFLVDDFEDGNLIAAPGTEWYKITDQPLGGKSTVDGTVVNGGAAGTKKSGRISGVVTTDFKYGGFAGMGVHVNREGKGQDMSTYSGLSFYCKGDGGKYRVSVMSAAVKDHNEFGKEFTAARTWTLVKIPFSELAQVQGWGTKVQWTGKDVRGVEFTTVGAPRQTYNLEIDQIAIY